MFLTNFPHNVSQSMIYASFGRNASVVSQSIMSFHRTMLYLQSMNEMKNEALVIWISFSVACDAFLLLLPVLDATTALNAFVS